MKPFLFFGLFVCISSFLPFPGYSQRECVGFNPLAARRAAQRGVRAAHPASAGGLGAADVTSLGAS